MPTKHVRAGRFLSLSTDVDLPQINIQRGGWSAIVRWRVPYSGTQFGHHMSEITHRTAALFVSPKVEATTMVGCIRKDGYVITKVKVKFYD